MKTASCAAGRSASFSRGGGGQVGDEEAAAGGEFVRGCGEKGRLAVGGDFVEDEMLVEEFAGELVVRQGEARARGALVERRRVEHGGRIGDV